MTTYTETSTKLILKLKKPRHVTFTEDTIDNEHLNKKKSKMCCIFHSSGNECMDRNKYERG